jgi:hypothetical protein
LGFLWVNARIFYYVIKELQNRIKELQNKTVRMLVTQERKRFLEKNKNGVYNGNSDFSITRAEFESLLEEYPFLLCPYYHGRWDYFEKTIEMAKGESPQTILEIGPNLIPLFPKADIMDINNLRSRYYRHDATKVPWPISDSKYDLVIALQVWEHLRDKQKQAFAEVKRVSKAAILSFPYKWYMPGDVHHMIDEKIIADWTLYMKPCRVEKVGSRIIYLFRF